MVCFEPSSSGRYRDPCPCLCVGSKYFKLKDPGNISLNHIILDQVPVGDRHDMVQGYGARHTSKSKNIYSVFLGSQDLKYLFIF